MARTKKQPMTKAKFTRHVRALWAENLRAALDLHDGNIAQTAKFLAIDRSQLYREMHNAGVSRADKGS